MLADGCSPKPEHQRSLVYSALIDLGNSIPKPIVQLTWRKIRAPIFQSVISMHIISKKALKLFWETSPDSESGLSRWFRIMQRTQFENFAELRATFPAADKVRNLVVFNIGGNKYRLIASIHFNSGRVYICHVLTHKE